MPADYQPPPTTPVVSIDDTTHTGVAYFPRRPPGYRGRHRAETDRPPLVRLDHGSTARHAAPDDNSGGAA